MEQRRGDGTQSAARPSSLTGALLNASDIANRYGVAVDFALHKPHRHGDERNYHAHILATTRQVAAKGLGAKAHIEWSDAHRAKEGLESGADELLYLRKHWEDRAN